MSCLVPGVNNVMEDVGNLRRRPAAAAEEKPPTSAPQIQTRENKPASVFRAAREEEEEEEAAAAAAAREVQVKDSCTENQEEHKEVRACTLHGEVLFEGGSSVGSAD